MGYMYALKSGLFGTHLTMYWFDCRHFNLLVNDVDFIL